MRTGQGAGGSGGVGGAEVSVNAECAVEMGSAAALLDVMTAAATSLDFFNAVSMSFVFLFDFGFLDFLWRALLSVFPIDTGPVALGARLKAFLGPIVGAMKLSARRTARLRPSGGGCWANRAEAFGDAGGVDCHEFGRAALRSGKGALGCKHLADSFSFGRVVKVGSRYGYVLVVTDADSARESGFSLSVCVPGDILVEVTPEWESWAEIGIAVGNWG